MRLLINNFAKIKEADIEINGITIIAGENNTAKSTVGKVLYSIAESFCEINDKISREREISLDQRVRRMDDILPHESRTITRELLSIMDEETSALQLEEKIFLCLVSHFPNIERTSDNIRGIMNIIKLSDEKIRVSVATKMLDSEFDKQWLPLNNNKNTPSIMLQMGDDQIQIHYDGNLIIDHYVSVDIHPIYLDDPQLLKEFPIFLFHKDNDHTRRTYHYLFDNSETDNLVEEILRNDKIQPILNKIDEIVGGQFVKTENGFEFQEKELEQPIRLSNLSTGLKSFAILKRILEEGHIVENGTLILDEPEIHLHPEWQLKFAEILVILQKSLHLNILINSHSPYFINAIEAYSSQYEIADQCKYYLSDLKSDGVYFLDVTTSTEQIYAVLARPLQILDNLVYGG